MKRINKHLNVENITHSPKKQISEASIFITKSNSELQRRKIPRLIESKQPILLITHCFPPLKTGPAFAIDRIARRLNNEVNLHVLTQSYEGVSTSDTYLNSRIDSHLCIHTVGPCYDGTDSLRYAYSLDNLVYAIENLDKRYNYALYHAFYLLPAGLASVIVGKRRSKKVIVSVRGGDLNTYLYMPERFSLIRWTLENATALSFVNAELMKNANAIVPCKNKSTIIFNSIDTDLFKKLKIVKVPGLKGMIIGTLGKMKRSKGFIHLLRAFKRFREEINATLFIIGMISDQYKEEYTKIIKKLGLEKEVIITGMIPHEDVPSYLRLIDIFVLPSISEGCSNALLEAMWCKKAIVGSNVGGISDIIHHNHNGLLFESRTWQSLFHALKRLAHDQQLRKRLAENAYATSQSFTSEAETLEWLNLYSKVLRNTNIKNC
jgi:glycosyltransferase involved in cell wall biosynthesis